MRRSTYKETSGAHASRFFTGSARRMVAAGVSATLAFSLAACGATNATTETGDAKSAKSAEATTSETAAAATADSDIYEVAKAFTIDAANLFSARDTDASYDADRATKITLADTGVTLKGTGAAVEGSNVTITDEGTYVVEGTISDGRIVVDAADNAKVQIVLAGASITSSGPSALYVRNADKVFLTLEGDKNAVGATGADAEEDEHNLDGTIFASVDLTINGTGSLICPEHCQVDTTVPFRNPHSSHFLQKWWFRLERPGGRGPPVRLFCASLLPTSGWDAGPRHSHIRGYRDRWCGALPPRPAYRCSGMAGVDTVSKRAWRISPLLREGKVSRLGLASKLGPRLPGRSWYGLVLCCS